MPAIITRQKKTRNKKAPIPIWFSLEVYDAENNPI